MAKYEIKTKPTDQDVVEFINSVSHEKRRRDAFRALEMMKHITGHEPVMWGESLIGFDQYHYKYDSGHEGDMLALGFSPRKANMVFYLMPGYHNIEEHLAKLGKHKLGKSCLYITDLDKVDMEVLEEMCTITYQSVKEKYST